MPNSKGNLLLIASAILILSGFLAYSFNSGTGQDPNPTGSESGGSTERTTPPPSQPSCKKCASVMKLRTNFKTKELFWGCSAYPNCRYTEDYLGGPVTNIVIEGKALSTAPSTSSFNTANLINASVIRYHLKQYGERKFWSYKVHENLKSAMSGSELHSFNRSNGYYSGPDMILTSKKNGKAKAYEYQYGRNYTWFSISESRYSDLKRYHKMTGNPTYWVMSTGGVPLEGNDRINDSFVPKEIFAMPIDQIKLGTKYHINDAFREKYSLLGHIKFVETD